METPRRDIQFPHPGKSSRGILQVDYFSPWRVRCGFHHFCILTQSTWHFFRSRCCRGPFGVSEQSREAPCLPARWAGTTNRNHKAFCMKSTQASSLYTVALLRHGSPCGNANMPYLMRFVVAATSPLSLCTCTSTIHTESFLHPSCINSIVALHGGGGDFSATVSLGAAEGRGALGSLFA
jgi:hypothetical protein